MSTKTEPSAKIAAEKASADQELLDHLTTKAVKTMAWEAEQRKRRHQLYEAVFPEKKPAKSK
jgi:hypothetical protein